MFLAAATRLGTTEQNVEKDFGVMLGSGCTFPWPASRWSTPPVPAVRTQRHASRARFGQRGIGEDLECAGLRVHGTTSMVPVSKITEVELLASLCRSGPDRGSGERAGRQRGK